MTVAALPRPARFHVPCDSTGHRLVPCARDDPGRWWPLCGGHDPWGRCDAEGCRDAVRLVTCGCATPDR